LNAPLGLLIAKRVCHLARACFRALSRLQRPRPVNRWEIATEGKAL
jgi:hypothetical protein